MPDALAKNIPTLIPLAEELKVIIAIEEVWNKFLLSPLEMAKYVDEFKSPWIRQYFDVGNVVLYGYPQDRIHTLGKRFVKVHLKDFKVLTHEFSPFRRFVNFGDGDIDWQPYQSICTLVTPDGPEPRLIRATKPICATSRSVFDKLGRGL